MTATGAGDSCVVDRQWRNEPVDAIISKGIDGIVMFEKGRHVERFGRELRLLKRQRLRVRSEARDSGVRIVRHVISSFMHACSGVVWIVNIDISHMVPGIVGKPHLVGPD